MRAIWTGAIGFGLVNIPIRLYSAVQASELNLDMLDKKDNSNIKFQRINERTGKVVNWQNIVRGYKLEDQYVVLTDEDFKKASPEKTKTIEITDFVKEQEIESIYYESSYFIEPDKSGARPYALLRDALMKSGKVGVARYVLRNKESLGVVKVLKDTLVLHKIRYAQELRDPSELNIPEKGSVKPAELKMALALIDQFTAKFDISKYEDTYTSELMKLIKAKAKGKKINTPKLNVVHSKSHDLMAQLKASLETKRKKAS
jgi:DNA end-binding protein Ku